MPPKKRRRGKRKSFPKLMSRQLRVLLASLALVGFLLGTLVLLTYWQQTTRPKPAPISKAPAKPSAKPVKTARGERRAPLAPKPAPAVHDEVRPALEKALAGIGVRPEQLRIETDHGLKIFVVDGHFPPPALVDVMAARLRREIPHAQIETAAGPWSLAVVLERRVVWLARFRLPPLPAVEPVLPLPSTGRPRLAIIMDDLGRDLSSAETLLSIDLPVTFSILPYNERAPEVATLGHVHGREVLLHIPMEPKDFPRVNPGPDALLLSLADRDIRQRFRNYRQRVPHAVGGNNHMGSRFTQSREKMTVVMEEMRAAGMFFVDSRTSSQSAAFAAARDVGVPVLGRDMFLDNIQDEALIADELHELVRLTIRRGQAVGICHPYPQTLAALRREAAFIRSQGIDIVPVSRLLPR